MGGPGSGYGKRPDHPVAVTGPTSEVIKTQKKHLKSVFSNRSDPSCHAHKLERDRRAGNKDYEMSAERRKIIGLTYKEMQDIACQHAQEMMKVLRDVASDPDQPSSARVSAANSWLDRAFGKAASTNFNVNTSVDAKPSELDDANLTRQIAETLQTAGSQRREIEEVEGEERPKSLREYN